MSNITKDQHLTKMGTCVTGKKIKNDNEETDKQRLSTHVSRIRWVQ